MYRPVKLVEKCQCCIQRVALANLEGSSDLFGNHNTPEVINRLYDPPVSFADSPLYTRGPFLHPTIILQITLFVSVNKVELYRPKQKLLCDKQRS